VALCFAVQCLLQRGHMSDGSMIGGPKLADIESSYFQSLVVICSSHSPTALVEVGVVAVGGLA
jgi:hypothetical protein